jgi:hypothetical protein
MQRTVEKETRAALSKAPDKNKQRDVDLSSGNNRSLLLPPPRLLLSLFLVGEN